MSKDGWTGSNRTKAFWRVFIPGSLVEGADPVTIVDQIPEGPSHWEDSVRITSVPVTQEGWGEFQANDGQAVAPDRYEVSSSGNELSIDLQPTPSCSHAVPAQLVAI